MSQTLLFLPGAGADPKFWVPVGDRLPSSWRKVYFGWPGLGAQAPSASIRGFADLVALVESQLDDAPVDLLAQSMGGAIALCVALKYPSRIRRLVLAATAGGIDVAGLGGSDWRPAYRRDFPRAAPWITEPAPDLTRDLPRLAHPTLLLWGDADPISPIAVGQKLRELLPNAHLHLVPGGDHAMVNQRAPEIAEIVQRHLQ